MATHFSILAWRIPWAEEPGGLGHRVAKSQTRLKRLKTRIAMPVKKICVSTLCTPHTC